MTTSNEQNNFFLMENKTSNLGDRVKLARKRSKLTQDELAEKLGVTTRTINHYENNQRNPKRNMLIAIAKVCDINIAWLKDGRGIPTKNIKEIGSEMKEMKEAVRTVPVYIKLPEDLHQRMKVATSERKEDGRYKTLEEVIVERLYKGIKVMPPDVPVALAS